MKIAYVTTFDPLDVHAWSGSNTYIMKALQESGFQMEIIGNLKKKITFLNLIKTFYYRKIISMSYIMQQEPIVLAHYATQIEKHLASIKYDIIFSPSTIPIAYLETDNPVVFWTDATFAGMINYYPPPFTNLCAESIKNGNKMEQLALSKCRIAIYSSEWAANTAIKNYDVDSEKVKVVPFGANISCDRNLQDIRLILRNKNFDVCKLLFVGVDWFRKGGDIALKIADLLIQRGINTELHIVGCNPSVSLPTFVKRHGFILKNTEEGRRSFDKLMSESHFLILPARAECCAVVLAEASSFGLPSLATRVGGIPTAIQDGKNGKTFPLDENPEKYCDYIERLLSSKQEYNELALSSFREYSVRLNWLSAGRKVYDLIQEFCG